MLGSQLEMLWFFLCVCGREVADADLLKDVTGADLEHPLTLPACPLCFVLSIENVALSFLLLLPCLLAKTDSFFWNCSNGTVSQAQDNN